MPDMPVDELVPRGGVAREFNVVPRTIKRWEEAKLTGFDDPVVINHRVYHRRSRYEPVKHGRLQDKGARG
jgi:hypothetical protein